MFYVVQYLFCQLFKLVKTVIYIKIIDLGIKQNALVGCNFVVLKN